MVWYDIMLRTGVVIRMNLLAYSQGYYRGVGADGTDYVIPQAEVQGKRLSYGNNDFYGKSTSGYDCGIGYG
jgi:hypothetical protein